MLVRGGIMRRLVLGGAVVALVVILAAAAPWPASAETAASLKREFPHLETTKSGIALSELQSGGPPRDGIPAIDHPKFIPATQAKELGQDEPVVAIVGVCGAYAYPFRILIWHEIVNDRVCGRPLAITFCPLCNTAMVFDRRIEGRELVFGTTGRLRKSDLVMYDRQTETFWQQFTGESLLGTLHEAKLVSVSARVESFASFKKRYPDGKVLAPPIESGSRYGENPYVGYDRAPAPFLYKGQLPLGIDAMSRVVRVGDRAWSLNLVRKKRLITTEDGLEITWREGQNSALDKRHIAEGRDIGNVTVTLNGEDVPYSVDFAFAFSAFFPKAKIEK